MLAQRAFKSHHSYTSMRIPCFIDINSLVPVRYIINEHRWGKDAVIATYSQYGKGGVFPNGQIHRPWRIPSRTWWEVQDMNNIQGRKHHESLSLKSCIKNFKDRATTGITVEQWRSGLRGSVRAAFNDRDPARKKWSTSMTEARKPARVTSVKSLFFLSPITIAQDHIPSIPCTALSDKARSQSFCWIKENCRSLSATKQNIPKPRLEMTEAVLKVWRRAWAFSVSDAMTKTMSQHTKCHQDTLCALSFVSSVVL